MNKTIYITAAIDYINAKPHVGHAVEKIQADTLSRWYKSKGDDCYFVMGTDEMSLKNVQAAEKAGKTIQEYVDEYAQYFIDLKQQLNLSVDQQIRTTDKKHIAGAQKFWSLFKQEDIYKKNYKGLYCVGCEEFKLEKDLVDGMCPDHNTVPEEVEEENYFFKLSNYQNKLIELIESDKLQIMPEYRKNEMLSFIKGGLEDFSISRSKERARNWGVQVPGDPDQIMYVWVDALSSYITALDFAVDGELYKKYWEESAERMHVIGKGILRFHTVYWPAMLLSSGLPLPTKILCHEYLTIDGKKMSKSLGNIISPVELVDIFGTEATRYLLLSSLPTSKDGDISWDRMKEKYSADLSNSLGNLLQRTLSMINKYEIKIEKDKAYYDYEEEPASGEVATADTMVEEKIKQLQFDQALSIIWRLVQESNQFIDQKKPWQLAKEGNDNELSRVLNIVYSRLESIADLIEIFMPETSKIMKKQLEVLEPEVLFPRIEE